MARNLNDNEYISKYVFKRMNIQQPGNTKFWLVFQNRFYDYPMTTNLEQTLFINFLVVKKTKTGKKQISEKEMEMVSGVKWKCNFGFRHCRGGASLHK